MESVSVFNKLQAQYEKNRVNVKQIDIKIALDMSNNFSESEIFEAIKNYSHRSDDDSSKAGPYAKTIINNIKASYDKIKNKTKSKGKTDKTTDGLVSSFVKANKISRVDFF